MLPEVKEYFETLDGSDEVYNAHRKVEEENPLPRWNSQWGAEKRAEWYAAEMTRTLATLKLRQDLRERHYLAEHALKTHSDPVIVWLMTEHFLEDYRGYRDEVLKALPMTRAEMESFGDNRGWCGDYAHMLDRAEQAGILPDPLPDIADIDPLCKAFADLFGGSPRRYSGVLRKYLPGVIASYQERQAAQEKATEETPVKRKRVSRTKFATVETEPVTV